MSILERRLEALEAATGGAVGCERCRGLLVTVSHAITGEFHSATWNSEDISEGSSSSAGLRPSAHGAAGR